MRIRRLRVHGSITDTSADDKASFRASRVSDAEGQAGRIGILAVDKDESLRPKSYGPETAVVVPE